MERFYKVAELTFSVRMPDGFPLWNAMSNYAPFEVGSDDARESIFSLSIAEDIGDITDREAVYVEEAQEKDQPRVELYRLGDEWIFDVAPVQYVPICARVRANGDFTRGSLFLVERNMRSATFALNNALMLIYAFRTATLGVLEMHSSVVVNDGKGYLFLGKSGTGKSTHTSLWLKYIEGSRLLNDDNPIVRVLPDGQVRVYGSPWSGKTPCYVNDSAPVGAFVRLVQYPQNVIRQLSLPEAYATVYSSSSGYKYDPKMADGLYETTAAVVTSVPCFELKCLPDEAAAVLSSSTVKAERKVEE